MYLHDACSGCECEGWRTSSTCCLASAVPLLYSPFRICCGAAGGILQLSRFVFAARRSVGFGIQGKSGVHGTVRCFLTKHA